MSIRKKSFLALTALLLLGALALPAFATEGEPADDSTWTIYTYPQVRWGSNNRTIFLLDVLVPLYQTDKNILFLSPRLSLDDLEGKEVNFGVGYRHLLFSDKAVLGINGYYDARWTGWGTRHEQVGLGAEVMTDWVTGRFNGYFAVTDPIISGAGDADSTYTLRDVGIYMSGGRVEETLSGFDGEVGVKIPYLSKYVETWVYAGGYHFQGDYVDDVNGFSSRLEVIPTDFLRLGFEYRNDTINHDQYYGEVAMAIPFSIDNLYRGKNPFEGIGSRMSGDRTLKERMVEPVRRDVDVKVTVDGDNPNVPGIGTKLEDVVYVSENGINAAGRGTFELPYKSIVYAMNHSSATTVAVLNDSEILTASGGNLPDIAGMLIFGSGAPHPLYPLISNLPSGYPTIGNGLTVNGDSSTVMGIITNAGLTIAGNSITVRDITANGGVTVSGASGSIIGSTLNNNVNLAGINAVVTNSIFNDTLTLNGAGGSITGSTMNRNVNLNGNNCSIDSSKVYDPINIAGINCSVIGSIITVDGNNHAIRIPANGSGVIIQNNIITLTHSNGARAIDNSLDTAPATLGSSISPVTITGNEIHITTTTGAAVGISFGWSDETQPSAIYSVITGNLIDVNGNTNAFGIRMIAADNGSIFSTITGNTLTVLANGGDAYGLRIATTVSGTIGSILSPFTFTGNRGTITGSTDSYLLYLTTAAGGAAGSRVIMGGTTPGMGDNTFTTNGIWLGNYPTTGSPVFRNRTSITITP